MSVEFFTIGVGIFIIGLLISRGLKSITGVLSTTLLDNVDSIFFASSILASLVVTGSVFNTGFWIKGGCLKEILEFEIFTVQYCT